MINFECQLIWIKGFLNLIWSMSLQTSLEDIGIWISESIKEEYVPPKDD